MSDFDGLYDEELSQQILASLKPISRVLDVLESLPISPVRVRRYNLTYRGVPRVAELNNRSFSASLREIRKRFRPEPLALIKELDSPEGITRSASVWVKRNLADVKVPQLLKADELSNVYEETLCGLFVQEVRRDIEKITSERQLEAFYTIVEGADLDVFIADDLFYTILIPEMPDVRDFDRDEFYKSVRTAAKECIRQTWLKYKTLKLKETSPSMSKEDVLKMSEAFGTMFDMAQEMDRRK